MKRKNKYFMGLAVTSALFLGAASMTMAAGNQNGWNKNSDGEWTYIEQGKKVTGFQQIDNIWYYFDRTGIMAQDELITVAGETYYMNPAGAMATGWYRFDKDSDILYDYNIDVDDFIDNIQNPVFKTREEAYETVWLYFHKNGTGAVDEWVQSDVSGLWYYFDDLLMVSADFDHIIGNNRYGFDENGAMLVGWNYNYNNQSLLAPNKDSKTWYYYESNGKKFDVDSVDNRFGWKKIDGKWYCFKSELNLASGDSVGTLIVDTFFNNGAAADNESDFFYVDKDGVMATGVTTISKDAGYVENRSDWGSSSKKISDYTNKSIEVFFDKNGKAKPEVFERNRYYAEINDPNVKEFDTKTYAVTGSSIIFKASLAKDAFVELDNNTYYVDKYGDKLTSHALQIGYVTVTTTGGVDSYSFSATPTNAANEYRAYAVFDGKGIAHDNVAATRTAAAGSKKYISTGIDYNTQGGVDHVTIFYYNNKN